MNIRKATMEDAAGIAKVHVDSWRSTYKGLMPQSFLDGLSYEKRTELWKRNLSDASNDIFVAVSDTGQIIGFTTAGKREENGEPHSGDLTTLYLLDEWQGRGIGKLLLHAAMEAFHERGYTSVNVEVLTENKTRHFYEKYGAHYVKTVKLTIAGKVVDEDIYVWPSVEEAISLLQ